MAAYGDMPVSVDNLRAVVEQIIKSQEPAFLDFDSTDVSGTSSKNVGYKWDSRNYKLTVSFEVSGSYLVERLSATEVNSYGADWGYDLRLPDGAHTSKSNLSPGSSVTVLSDSTIWADAGDTLTFQCTGSINPTAYVYMTMSKQ